MKFQGKAAEVGDVQRTEVVVKCIVRQSIVDSEV